MCGIAGFCDFSKKSNKQSLICMTDILHHRGPDDSGYSFYDRIESNVGLGHRRLSIQDLTQHGHQPMAYENLEIVFNGEIYNFEEIKKELERLNYTFSSFSDTEVIIKAYHKWGINIIHKFNGMFAIAIYNKKDETITLIRDRAGVKPLYYYYKDGLFLFASELKSFHQNLGFQKEINKKAVELYLKYGYIPQPDTIFKNSYKLEAGSYIELNIKTKTLNNKKYWSIDKYVNKPKLNIDYNEAKSELKDMLSSSFKYRMVSDVPVGVFLSGGYDSSAVSAILQTQSTKKIKTFSIGFKEEKYNEAIYAKEVSTYLDTEHYEYYLNQKDALEILPTLPEIYDEPFGDSSCIPTIMVSQFAKKYVSVALSADGGDELFSGYPSYKKIHTSFENFNKVSFLSSLYQIENIIDPYLFSKLINIYNFEGKYYKVLESLRNSKKANAFYDTNTRYFYDIEINQLLNSTLHEEVKYDENSIENMLSYSFKTYLNDDILTKVDRATMSVSLEGREPFLDYRLIEYVSQLPIEYKQNGNITKYILKDIVHDYIPKEIMDREKMGFSIPIFEWFRDELKEYFEYYLSEEKIKDSGIFNWVYIDKLKNRYYQGYGNPHKLWIILMFQMWWEKWAK